jgi:signal peptidase I
VPSERLEVVEIRGGCMWPGLRDGDLVLYRPRSPLEPGQIVVARSELGLIAHRVRAVLGARRVVLGGDLRGDDPPRDPSEILGVARALYRPGQGFVDLPARLETSPLGAAVLTRAAQLWSWATRKLG